jgi:hypothetical protein
MENILLITNYKLNNIIESINKQKDIDHLNKSNTDVDNKISEKILTSTNAIFDSIVPIIDFFTNPDLTEILFDQNVAITELLQIHYEYIESTKDNDDFNEELLEDYLVNFYSYKTTPFAKYLTCSETIRCELIKLKLEFNNTRDLDSSGDESIVREAKSKGELVGGGIVDKAAILSSIVLLLGSSFIGITQASQAPQIAQENKQVAAANPIQEILPRDVNDTRYATALYEERVTVIRDIYTSDIAASLGAIIVSAGVIGSLSTWFYGDDNVKAWGELLNTIAGVNTANDEICTTAIQSLSEYFQTFEEAFDASAYDITKDETFDEVLAAAEEAVDEAVVKVEVSGYTGDFSIGPPVNKDMKHIKTGLSEFMTPVRDEILTEGRAAQLNSDIHDAVSDIIKNKHKKAAQMKLFEKSKLFELGRLCNANLFSGIWGEEALIRVDLHSNAFRTATYENILDNFSRNPSSDNGKLVQYKKLQHVLKVLNPLDLMGKLSGILDQHHLSTPVVIQEVNSMLSKYKADLEIINRYDDPSGVFDDIKKRKDAQEKEALRRIQAEFDMEVTRNATKLANKQAEELIDSRLSAANNAASTLQALSTLWSSWTSGVTGVVLDPVAGVVDKTVGTVTDLAVEQSYTLFSGFMKIAAMAGVTLAAGISILVCFKSSGAISAGLSSMIPTAADAAGDMVRRASEAVAVGVGDAAGHAATAVGTAAGHAAAAVGTAAGHAAAAVGDAAGHAASSVGEATGRILSTGTLSRWDRGGSSRQTRKKRGGGLGFSRTSDIINDDDSEDIDATANASANPNPNPNAAAPARRSRWGPFVPVPAPASNANPNDNANSVGQANGRILSTGTPSRWDRGGNSRQTRKKRRTRKNRNKKNKRTRKNRRTRKNKRAKNNKNKSRKK